MILDHNGIVWNCWTGALARLGVARANALQANAPQRRRARACAYKDFLNLWKDVDADIPILKQAKTESAKMEYRAEPEGAAEGCKRMVGIGKILEQVKLKAWAVYLRSSRGTVRDGTAQDPHLRPALNLSNSEEVAPALAHLLNPTPVVTRVQ